VLLCVHAWCGCVCRVDSFATDCGPKFYKAGAKVLEVSGKVCKRTYDMVVASGPGNSRG
jgi:hypothetical protein